MKLRNLKPILIILKLILAITMILIIILSNRDKVVGAEDREYVLMEDIEYMETLEDITNPERGFYNTEYLKLSTSGNKPVNPKANLTHLRVGIGDFSGANNGDKDIEFTQDALDSLNTTLSNIKNNGGSAIIRFAYDNFNGNADIEPSLDMILKHISQLEPVIEKNQDVISYIELGFFGPWGEMHTSKICTTDNVSKAIDAMLDVTPQKIKIGVRTPNYYAKWIGIDRAKLDENITEKGTSAYRVGLYNDGYLGSESDLGTFSNREIEIRWLEKQAMHTFYGGEVVANYATGDPLNTARYMSEEAFRTHTTYLNSEWNNTVINKWKEETYDGDNKLYVGQTGYKYISNHLGYRFVLRKSEIINKFYKNDNLKIKLQIENVGFANLINEKKVSLVLEKAGKIEEIPINIDVTKWNSKEISDVDIVVSLPEDIEIGEWNIYLRISQYGDINTDKNYKTIQLANANIWDKNLGANYIGKVSILEKIQAPEEVEKPDTSEDTENPDIPEHTEKPEDEDKSETLGNTAITEEQEKEDKANNKTDKTTVTGKLPKTGSNIEIIALICLILITNIIICYKKIRNI